MSKKLNTDIVTSELSEGSVFFRGRRASEDTAPAAAPSPDEAPVAPVRSIASKPARTAAIDVDSRDASSRASTPDSNDDSVRASSIDSVPDSTNASQHDSGSDSVDDSVIASEQASRQSRKPARANARTLASRTANSLSEVLAGSADLSEAIYRVVKRPGKEISYVRMSEREKSELSAVLARITQDHGYKVSETELIRIAICALLADHAESGDDSLLMQVIIALKD